MKRLDKFDDTFKSQELFSRAALYGDDLPFDEQELDAKERKDSIEFISKKEIKNKDGEGYIYFFKRKSGESKKWKLDYAGLQPKNEKEVEGDPRYTRQNIPLYEDKTIEEQIDEIVKDLNLIGRKRVGSDFGGYNFNMFQE